MCVHVVRKFLRIYQLLRRETGRGAGLPGSLLLQIMDHMLLNLGGRVAEREED